MQGIDLSKAMKYNKRKAGKLWDQGDLPWPLSMEFPAIGFVIDYGSESFAYVVAAFQNMHGLLPDGKVGPATFAVMTTSEPAVQESGTPQEFESEDEKVTTPSIRTVSTKAARRGVSNCLIIDDGSVQLPDEMIQLGITASNYRDDDEKQFTQYRERTRVSVFVFHESVTMSAAQTNRILDRKREKSAKAGKKGGKGYDYGIHLNLAPDGHISCHADLVRHRLVHAGQMNSNSIGLEVVNPYNPAYGKSPFDKTIKGPWWCWKPKGRDKVYTLPTPAQMRAFYPLIKFLTETIDTLPMEFPTAELGRRKGRIDGWRDYKKTGSGIVAHRDFSSHSDGRYMLEHCIEMDSKPLHERS